MRSNLRMAAEFNPEVSARFGVPGLVKGVVIDDNSNLLHEIDIEYAIVEEQLYRRMTYTLIAMQSMKKVITCHNEMAEQLLFKIAAALSGSTLANGRGFEKAMFVLPHDETWDYDMPGDKPKPKAAAKKKKEASNE